ncbi:phosphatase PAP2 family protein [Candidatus Omnitrophota bacterium]
MLTDIERAIFHFFNETSNSVILDYAMPVITELGSGILLFAVAIIMLVLNKRRMRASGILLLAGITSSHYVVRIIKNLVARPRPFIVLPEVNTVFTIGGFSFPSGHASMAFMGAFILTKCFGKGYIFFPIAAVVALSRVYLGLHYFSDAAIGSIIGCLIGFIISYAAESVWGSSVWEEGV